MAVRAGEPNLSAQMMIGEYPKRVRQNANVCVRTTELQMAGESMSYGETCFTRVTFWYGLVDFGRYP